MTTNREAYSLHYDALTPRYAQCTTCDHTRSSRGGLAALSRAGWTWTLGVGRLRFKCAECSKVKARRKV